MARAFADEGVDTLFSLMGDANMYWMASLLDLGVANVHVRHENAAVAAADGYARATGKVGVATVTSGPGLVHAGTALTGAARYGVPLVLFAGDTVPGDAAALQWIDHRAFAAVCGVHCEYVVAPGRALDAVRAAFARARSLREPVLLSVPMNIQDAELPGEYAYGPAPAPDVVVPSPEALDDAAGLIAFSQRPIIVVGDGALAGGALDAVTVLGDRIGALYATTLRAKGALADSPWGLGVAGTFAVPATQEAFKEADLVIGVGASLNHFTRQEGFLFPQARTIQIADRPAAAIAQAEPVTRFLQGDARRTVELLTELLDTADVGATGFRATFDPAPFDPYADQARVEGAPDGMDPRELVERLDAAIPDGALVVSGAGHFWGFVARGLTGRGGRQFMYALGFGSIGQALPVAVGAAVGRPDTPVVIVDGDSSILFHLAELDTAARLGCRLLAVVMDDDAMGAELHKLVLRGVRSEDAVVRTPDLARTVEGLGATGSLARTGEELTTQLEGYDWRSVALIQAKMTRDVVDVASVMGNKVSVER
jgi:thiamine pyrophosphate-dependent acetolactate synthase large subunit-like protein